MQNTKVLFDSANYITEIGFYKNKNIIWVKFPKNIFLIQALKSSTKAHWSRSRVSWYVLDNEHNRKLFNLEPKIVGKEVLMKIHDENLQEFQKFINQLKLKAYSVNTIRTYATEFAQLLYVLKSYPVQNLSPEKLKSYFLYCIETLHVSENLLHSRINAIKFYYEQVLHKEKMFFDIPRPKKPLLLPKSLNKNEIKKIIACTENNKHRLIIQMCYGMGLRVSEVVNLKLEDIDSATMRVLVSLAKGKKDRYVNLPESILLDLRNYYQEFRPKVYLFEGQFGAQYSIRSAQMVFKNAMKKAGINKSIGIHGLRHSFATHLIESGTDVSFIQKLLGHNDIKTTLNYLHVGDRQIRNIKSPLDSI